MTNAEFINESTSYLMKDCHEYTDLLFKLTMDIANIDYPSVAEEDYPVILQVIVTKPSDNPFGSRCIVTVVDKGVLKELIIMDDKGEPEVITDSDQKEWLREHGWNETENGFIKTIELKDVPKQLVLQDRYESLLNGLKEKGILDEQKHADPEDSPEKDYWHYGYAIASRDIDRSFYIFEKPEDESEVEKFLEECNSMDDEGDEEDEQ